MTQVQGATGVFPKQILTGAALAPPPVEHFWNIFELNLII